MTHHFYSSALKNKEHWQAGSGGTTTIRVRPDASGIVGGSILDDLATPFASETTFETRSKQPYGYGPAFRAGRREEALGDGGESGEHQRGQEPRLLCTRSLSAACLTSYPVARAPTRLEASLYA